MGSVPPSPVLCQCPGYAPLPPQQVYDVLLPVWSQRQSLSVSQASTLVSLATVALQLLRQMLGGLIEGEDFQFRDMRVASTLLKLHTVLCSAPYSAVATNAAPEVSIRVKPCSEIL